MSNVKGVLFADYVRMIRSRKEVDWSLHFGDDVRAYLAMKIDATAWYPMAVFEQLGNAIFKVVAEGQMDLVRLWGYHSATLLVAEQPTLLAPSDPVDTLRRFRVLRASYFDFDALQIPMLHEDEAEVVIGYGMGMPAEEAASWQALGFFERLLELADASDVVAALAERSWMGDKRTLLTLMWKPPGM